MNVAAKKQRTHLSNSRSVCRTCGFETGHHAQCGESEQQTLKLVEEFKTNRVPPRYIELDADGILFGIKNKISREFINVRAADSDRAKIASKWSEFEISYLMQLESSKKKPMTDEVKAKLKAINDERRALRRVRPKAEGRGKEERGDDMSSGTLEALKQAREKGSKKKAPVYTEGQSPAKLPPLVKATAKEAKEIFKADAKLNNNDASQPAAEKAAEKKESKTVKTSFKKQTKKSTRKTGARKAATKAVVKKAQRSAPVVAAPKAKTESSKRGSIFLFDHPVTSVVRWMGKDGFTFAEAYGAMAALKVKPMPTEQCTKTFLYAGKAGQRGAPAKLTAEQQKKLRDAAKAVSAKKDA